MKSNYSLITLLAFTLILTSCIHTRYFNQVRKNTDDFAAAVVHLKQVNFSPIDSLKTECIYRETTDSLVKKLMAKYQLKRICLDKRGGSQYKMAITFHRNYNPFFGKADVIYYDFGESGWRDMAISGVRKKGERLRIIDDSFVYVLYSKPAFGF